MTLPLISYHGSHSGEFCMHATPCKLSEVIAKRIEIGFTHFGTSEHQPMGKKEFFYPEEAGADLSVTDLEESFARYIDEARRLQNKYSGQAEILVGFETEFYDHSSLEYIKYLKEKYNPDYIVGSIHHVDGVMIDFSQELFDQLCLKMGGLNNLLEKYFDLQYQLIRECQPEVIGHFDLIKLFAPEFKIEGKLEKLIKRNILAVNSYGGVFEINTRGFNKAVAEQYPNSKILDLISETGGEITLGDDSHSLDDIAANYEKVLPLIKNKFKYLSAFEIKIGRLNKIKLKI